MNKNSSNHTPVFSSLSEYANLSILDLYMAAQQDPLAMTEFATVLLSHSTISDYLTALGLDVKDPETYLDQVIATTGLVEPRYFKAILIAMRSDGPEQGREALEMLGPLIRINHRHALNVAAGICRANLGAPDRAEQFYKASISAGNHRSNLDLASMLLHTDIQQAIECLDRAIRDIPTDEPVKFAIGLSFEFPLIFSTHKLTALLTKHADTGHSDCVMALLELVNAERIPVQSITSKHVEVAFDSAAHGFWVLPLLLDLYEAYPQNPIFDLNEIKNFSQILLDGIITNRKVGGYACEVLGRIAMNGLGSGDPDLYLALSFFLRGGDRYEHLTCWRYTIIIFLKLKFYEAGLKKALELMDMDADCMALTGFCLMEGRGCVMDQRNGQEYLQHARRRGSTIQYPFV